MILGLTSIPSANTTKKLSNSKSLTVNNTTANVPLFRIIGTVRILKLYGIVTTALGTNHTEAYFRLNDQTAQTDITLSTGGSTLSSFSVGSFVGKTNLSSSVATIKNSNVGQFSESTTAGIDLFAPFTLTKKSGANTDIEYVYTSTNTPHSGVIQFFVEFQTLSDDGDITAV